MQLTLHIQHLGFRWLLIQQVFGFVLAVLINKKIGQKDIAIELRDFTPCIAL